MMDDSFLGRMTDAIADVLRAREAFIAQNVASWPHQVTGYGAIELAKVALAEVVLDYVGYSDDPTYRDVVEAWERVECTRVRDCRMPPKWLRDRIFRRDGSLCPDCGATEHLTIDHIVPFSKGGPTTESNLRVLCHSCNSAKGAR